MVLIVFDRYFTFIAFCTFSWSITRALCCNSNLSDILVILAISESNKSFIAISNSNKPESDMLTHVTSISTNLRPSSTAFCDTTWFYFSNAQYKLLCSLMCSSKCRLDIAASSLLLCIQLRRNSLPHTVCTWLIWSCRQASFSSQYRLQWLEWLKSNGKRTLLSSRTNYFSQIFFLYVTKH